MSLLRFFKKSPGKRAQPVGGSGPGKRQCTANRQPRKIVSWNANGLGTRLSKDRKALEAFIQREQPDVLCIQGTAHSPGDRASDGGKTESVLCMSLLSWTAETRLPAQAPPGAKKNDGPAVWRGAPVRVH